MATRMIFSLVKWFSICISGMSLRGSIQVGVACVDSAWGLVVRVRLREDPSFFVGAVPIELQPAPRTALNAERNDRRSIQLREVMIISRLVWVNA